MKTPRKRICFKTPKRKPIKNTKSFSIESKSYLSQDSSQYHKNKIIADKENIETRLELEVAQTEEKLIQAYIEENKFLREINSDVLLFKKFLGLEIKILDVGLYEFSQRIDSRFIKFTLLEEDDSLVYKLIDCFGLELAGFFMEKIVFKKTDIFKFFYKIFEMFLMKECKID
ncbi:hypothetical protein TUBRATIS_11800 [Tubulinosema ratisbonensis]|uniref:DUF5094 domain-containing protein n=1 Tax=Tubulinosema ratisbonensis TaxID=291195 RepID=A0A437AM91_9MICR|nr:hypothetical protein TUBRATIS_11800 [Tubulinosema ratisbonensis]